MTPVANPFGHSATAPNLSRRHRPASLSAEIAPLAIALCFVLLSGGVEGFISRQVSPDWDNRLALLITFSLGFVIPVIAITTTFTRFFITSLLSWPLVIFFVLAFVSVKWSVDPNLTFQSALQGSLLLMIGVSVAAMASWRSILVGLALACLAIGGFSVLIIPLDGLMTEIHPGALRGIFPEKNEFGAVMAIGVFACFVVAVADRSLWYVLGAFILLCLIVLSKSATSLMAAFGGVAVFLGIEIIRRGPVRYLTGVWLGVIVVALVGLTIASLGAEVTGSVGRENTFTGRTLIWPTIIHFIEESPKLGYGYMAFWGEGSTQKELVWMQSGFEAQTAHNGLFELMLALGFVGTSIYLFSMLRTFFQGLVATAYRGGARRYVVPFILMGLLISISESALVKSDGLLAFAWMVFSAKAALGMWDEGKNKARN